MQTFAGIVMRALLIAMVFASIGLVVNRAADDPVPWVYAPPREGGPWLVSRYSSLTKKRPQSFWTIRQLFLWIHGNVSTTPNPMLGEPYAFPLTMWNSDFLRGAADSIGESGNPLLLWSGMRHGRESRRIPRPNGLQKHADHEFRIPRLAKGKVPG